MNRKKITGTKKVKRVSKKTTPSVRKELNLNLRMELCTKVNGNKMSDTDMEFKNGQMEQSMRAIGRITKLTDKVCFGMFMVINMKVGGSEIKPMDTENTLTVMEQHMKEIGRMISNTAKV